MPYTNEGGDLEKLQDAFREITKAFGSFDDLMVAFGLADMPQAQRYGIVFGCMVFTLTITAVVMLLIFGGSFQRIAVQAETGDSTIRSPSEIRQQRALLYEQLLEGRQRMLEAYGKTQLTEGFTNLTKMLLNVAPDPVDAVETNGSSKSKSRFIPKGYEENYRDAYMKCQDRPGGPILPGRPEARFEAYARAYAGCGLYTTIEYRRSYGRMYEALACISHDSEDKYTELFRTRPQDIIGKSVRLEALEVDRHLSDLYNATKGAAGEGHRAYNPQEIWGFCEEGPFTDEQALRKSFVFQQKVNEAAFAIINNTTNRLIGAVLLRRDDPQNLSVQIDPPIVPPHYDGSPEQLETCYLLLDRLFALGYRRIQISIDEQDVTPRKLCQRLGFSIEGVLNKHMIIKDASRNSRIYGIMNSDWKSGARAANYRKLYGSSAQRADTSNEKREAEYLERERGKRENEEKEAKKKK